MDAVLGEGYRESAKSWSARRARWKEAGAILGPASVRGGSSAAAMVVVQQQSRHWEFKNHDHRDRLRLHGIAIHWPLVWQTAVDHAPVLRALIAAIGED